MSAMSFHVRKAVTFDLNDEPQYYWGLYVYTAMYGYERIEYADRQPVRYPYTPDDFIIACAHCDQLLDEEMKKRESSKTKDQINKEVAKFNKTSAYSVEIPAPEGLWDRFKWWLFS